MKALDCPAKSFNDRTRRPQVLIGLPPKLDRRQPKNVCRTVRFVFSQMNRFFARSTVPSGLSRSKENDVDAVALEHVFPKRASATDRFIVRMGAYDEYPSHPVTRHLPGLTCAVPAHRVPRSSPAEWRLRNAA